MDLISQDLTLPTPQVNGVSKVDGETRKKDKSMDSWRPCRNALGKVAQISLESLSAKRKQEIFRKLLDLDKSITGGGINLHVKKNEKTEIICHIRRALVRYINEVPITAIVVGSSAGFTNSRILQ